MRFSNKNTNRHPIVSFLIWPRFDFATARLLNDVIAPYVHLAPQVSQPSDEATAAQNYKDRKTLLFFQGTVHLHKVCTSLPYIDIHAQPLTQNSPITEIRINRDLNSRPTSKFRIHGNIRSG